MPPYICPYTISRLMTLSQLQNEITLSKNRSLIGKKLEVLVEGPSKRSDEQSMGRTDTNKIVVFPRRKDDVGQIIRLEITAAEGHTLFGSFADSK